MARSARRWLVALAAAWMGLVLLWGMGLAMPACAATSTAPPAQTEETDSQGAPTKGAKIAGFLAIFTVVCGGTAYLVMRPSLKKLKAAQAAAKSPADPESDSDSKSA